MPNALNLLIEYIREQGSHVLASPEDADFFRKNLPAPKKEPVVIAAPPPLPAPKAVVAPPPPPKVEPPALYPECLKNWELDKEAPEIYRLERDAFVGDKGSSENGKFRVKPTPSKTNFSVTSGIPKPVIKEAPAEPLVKPKTDFSIVRNVLSVVAPELLILNEIPNDAMAKKIAERWKTKNQTAPISILSYQEPPEQKALLEGIARALDVYFGPAKIVQAEGIEKEKQWGAFLSVEGLKMVIVCDYTLWQLNAAMQFYKETPAQGTRMLGNAPVFLLPDLSLYLKDPLLKGSLWKALCQKFS